MKQIALFTSKAKRAGGLEKFIHHFSKALLRAGHQVLLPSFFSHKRFSYQRIKEFDQLVTQWQKNNSCDIYFGVDRITQQTHLRAGNGVHAAYLKQRISVEPFYKRISFGCNPLHRTILSMEKRAFEGPELQQLFVNSEQVKNEILSFYNVDLKKIHVVHNGADFTSTQDLFNRWQLSKLDTCQKYGLPLDVLHLVFVGHGFQRKGLDYLLNALSVWKKHPFHLSIIGEDRSVKAYEQKVHALGLSAFVRFLGKRAPEEFYALADALVIPSLYDPFANVTIEALAMGTFVVSSKFNGGSEVCKENTGCIIDNLFSLDSFCQALDQIPIKTAETACKIRQSVSHLTLLNQLEKIIRVMVPDE